jgi:AcrR family transcriptional regulator
MSGDTRERLLSDAVEFIARTGVGELSLRRLAAGIGTSHRMLIYHFGSKEGLLVAVVRAVEERQRAALAELNAAADLPPEEQGRLLWQRVADPALWPHERLFFEVYAQALLGRPHSAPLLGGIVENWLGPLTEMGVRWGLPPRLARAYARLGIAVNRGLLLDLLATGDRAGVDEAMGLFLRTVAARLPVADADPGPRPTGRDSCS